MTAFGVEAAQGLAEADGEWIDMTNEETLHALGFARAGVFRSGGFRLAPEWRDHQVVYVWTRGVEAEALRVGIACGSQGFDNRYASYNRWLAGRFKPDDAVEQEKARLFRSRLDDTCEVWARRVADKPTALKEEAELRVLLGPVLELDLMTPGWAKQELAAWRRARSSDPSNASEPVIRLMKTKADKPTGHGITPGLVDAFSQLEALLTANGFAMTAEAQGWRFSQAGRRSFRLHPKSRKGCLRVFVGGENELAAPHALRDASYQQRGWLVVWPQDAELARSYLEACLCSPRPK